MKKLLLLVILTLITACSSGENGAYTKSTLVEDQLSKTIKSPWKIVDNESSDLAISNKVTNSFFIFNSACRKFDPSNLPTLTNSILTGINDVEIIEKSSTTHQDRDAVLITAKGSVDGIQRFFRILTTQKNNCIYDFALISTSLKNLSTDTTSFNNFIQRLKLN